MASLNMKPRDTAGELFAGQSAVKKENRLNILKSYGRIKEIFGILSRILYVEFLENRRF